MNDHQSADMPSVTPQNFLADIDLVAADGHYAPHFHHQDQLAWAQGGEMRVRIDEEQWHVSATEFVWIPANAVHELWVEGAETLLSFYLGPELRPTGRRWRQPLVLPVQEVAGAVFRHLCATPQPLARRQHGWALVRDILENTAASDTALVVPKHPGAQVVARMLMTEPADSRSLLDWSEHVGVSSRTLSRSFQADTGLTFSQWRTRARMYRAARLLSEGESVGDVALRVGYVTATGFIKAYLQVFNSTPAAHTRRLSTPTKPSQVPDHV